MRDYRAKLKAAKEVLSKSVHSGITVSVVTGPTGNRGSTLWPSLTNLSLTHWRN